MLFGELFKHLYNVSLARYLSHGLEKALPCAFSGSASHRASRRWPSRRQVGTPSSTSLVSCSSSFPASFYRSCRPSGLAASRKSCRGTRERRTQRIPAGRTRTTRNTYVTAYQHKSNNQSTTVQATYLFHSSSIPLRSIVLPLL